MILRVVSLWLLGCGAAYAVDAVPAPDFTHPGESAVTRLPDVDRAAEPYFSPDGQRLIFNAKTATDDAFHTYTARLDGSELTRINDTGEDACSFFFPDGKTLLFTSTRDHLTLPKGDWSDSTQYPQGAELYTAALDGSARQRLTHNTQYDAEASVSPDGQWILFTRQIDGRLDLWRMRRDGSQPQQITTTDDWQKGGAFYLPDGKTIVYRAWRFEDEGKRGKPMDLFLIHDDSTGLRRLTDDGGVNWAPFPAPDGKHVVFAKMLPPHNFELFLLNLDTGEQKQLTFFEGFDGFPSLSPDGRRLAFASSRAAAPGERKLSLYWMDVSALGLQPR